MRRLAVVYSLGALAALIAGCGTSPSGPRPITRAGQLHQPGAPVLRAPVRPAVVPKRFGAEGAADGRVTAAGASCGRERWDVKTATDPAAGQISLTPKDTTIAALNALPSQNTGGNLDLPRQSSEMQVYRVTATLVEAKLEADSDLHLVLHDGTASMIAEIPLAPGCTEPPVTPQVSVLETQIEAARNQFIQEFGQPSGQGWLQINHQVTVTGVFFNDVAHGQTGVADNAAELHPVLSIQDP